MRGDAREAEHGAGEAMHCPHCLVVMPPASGFCTACGRIPSCDWITLTRTLRVFYGLVLAIGTIGSLLIPAVMAWVCLATRDRVHLLHHRCLALLR